MADRNCYAQQRTCYTAKNIFCMISTFWHMQLLKKAHAFQVTFLARPLARCNRNPRCTGVLAPGAIFGRLKRALFYEVAAARQMKISNFHQLWMMTKTHGCLSVCLAGICHMRAKYTKPHLNLKTTIIHGECLNYCNDFDTGRLNSSRQY